MKFLLAISRSATHRLFSSAERFTNHLQILVFAAFSTSLVLSFYGALNAPLIYAAMLCIWIVIFHLLSAEKPIAFYQPSAAPNYIYYITALFVAFLIFQSFFTMPISSDGQRIKLARILLSVDHGSAWATGGVDALSTMFNFPSAYYLIFTPIEALHLPQVAYAIFNTALIIGSLLNLSLLWKQRSAQSLFPLIVFFTAPQFIFSALSEHEEALTLFLASRSAVWLITRPLGYRSICFACACALLAFAVKYTAALFLPFALLALILYSDPPRLREWLHGKTLAAVLLFTLPMLAILFIPDVMVSHAQGMGLFEHIEYLSKVHVASGSDCGFAHIIARLFEFAIDDLHIFLSAFTIDITHYLPSYRFLPEGCSSENTSLINYLAPDDIARTNTAFGLALILPLLGLFATRGQERKKVIASLLLFLASIALYSFRMHYWLGTARYFIIASLCLLPGFIVTLQALAQRLRPSAYYFLLVLLLFPAIAIGLDSETSLIASARNLVKGDYYSRQAARLTPALNQLHGKVNIYFNDIMAFYALMRAVPSADITLKKAIMPDATNIVAIPQEYSSYTNWHDAKWLLPIPSSKGGFHPIGNVGNFFANRVPASFFSDAVNADAPGFTLHFLPPSKRPAEWLKDLGPHFSARSANDHYFLSEQGAPQGLCILYAHDAFRWQAASFNECGKL